MPLLLLPLLLLTCAGGATAGNRTCQLSPATSFDGHDIAKAKMPWQHDLQKNEQACCEACSNRQGCTAWTLYQGSVTRKLLDYSGLVLNGFTDFVAPGVVTLISLGAAQRIARCCRWCPTPSSSATGATYIPAGAVGDPRRRGDPAKGSSSTTPYGDLSPTELRPVGSRVGSTLIHPFPAVLRPLYVEIVAGMVAFLLVVLPVAVWLQAND